MVKSVREAYNQSFTQEKYEAFVNYLTSLYNYEIEFRIAETPFFCDKAFSEKLVAGGEQIVDVMCRSDIKAITERAIPANFNVPNEGQHPTMVSIDFAVCEGEHGELMPQLIEFQGFPSLFAFQQVISPAYKKFFWMPEGYSYFFNGLTQEKYLDLLGGVLLNGHKSDEVILMEIEPEEQKTKVDFYATKQFFGIQAICLSQVFKEGNHLFYLNNGVKTQIKRVYNRVIFDELERKPDFKPGFDMTEAVDVEWVGHPNWFFRTSKFTMPFIKSPFVPETKFLHEFETIPADLENYVLKPLFSFSGTGVIFNVKPEDIAAIADRENFILQRKVKYAPVLKSPTGDVKCEIRLLYLWPEADARPTLCTNLIRLSKGVMMGVKFNKDQTWVGGGTAFLEQ